MAGIIDQAMRKEVPQQPQAGPSTETPDVRRITTAAREVLAQPEIQQQIVQMLRAAKDPATGIAQATIFLMKQLYEKSGGTMPTQSIVPAAKKVLSLIVTLGVAAGVFKYSPELVQNAAELARQMFSQSVKKPAPEQTAPEQPAAGMPATMPAAQPMMEA